jgi:hypothetical protein
MRLQPLQQWKCDACGQIIERPDVGWVEWLAGPTQGTKAHGFRIVHNSNLCQYPSSARVHDIHLLHLVGSDGLATLLSLLAPGRPAGNREDGVTSIDEWAELVRRVQVPHYEEARQYWADAKADGFFAEPEQQAPYSQATLIRVLERYGHATTGTDSAGEVPTRETPS